LIDRLADDVHDSAERSATDGNRDGTALVDRFHAAHHAVGRFHGHAAHPSFTEVLLHLEEDFDGDGNVETVTDDFDSLIDGGQMPFLELDVDGWTCDLNYMSYILWHKFKALSFQQLATGN
jgi:hypothetical protein